MGSYQLVMLSPGHVLRYIHRLGIGFGLSRGQLLSQRGDLILQGGNSGLGRDLSRVSSISHRNFLKLIKLSRGGNHGGHHAVQGRGIGQRHV